MCLERWDESARVHYDKTLLNELASLRFIETSAHVTIVGPVGVGKTFLAHSLGHIACRRGYSVFALRADQMLNTLVTSRQFLLDALLPRQQPIHRPVEIVFRGVGETPRMQLLGEWGAPPGRSGRR